MVNLTCSWLAYSNSDFSFFRKIVPLPPPYLVWTSKCWESPTLHILLVRPLFPILLWLVLSSLFKSAPRFHFSIHQSLIKHHSEMAIIEYREDDVRLSELETRLSSNAESLSKVVDTTASKLPSSSSSPPFACSFWHVPWKRNI